MFVFLLQERNFLNFRKSSPVANPDKGSHYLKKSPSPTGVKSPPGCDQYSDSLSPSEEYVNKRPLISTSPQVNNIYTYFGTPGIQFSHM